MNSQSENKAKKLPCLDDLYSRDDNCYEAAQGLAEDFPVLIGANGTYNSSPHAWCVGPDGTIYDPAFWTVDNDSYEPVAIIPESDARHKFYLRIMPI